MRKLDPLVSWNIKRFIACVNNQIYFRTLENPSLYSEENEIEITSSLSEIINRVYEDKKRGSERNLDIEVSRAIYFIYLRQLEVENQSYIESLGRYSSSLRDVGKSFI